MRYPVRRAVCAAALIATVPVFAQAAASSTPATSQIYASDTASSPAVTDGMLALAAVCGAAGLYLLGAPSGDTDARS
jgi:hypothetical protein